VWTGAKPATGIAEAARLARYALLAEAAREAATDIVLTGHTMDDQAETVAMRLARGGGRGAAGMAQTVLFRDRLWIVRPLLSQRRERLRAVLRGLGQAWIDDPSNESDASERVRMRKALASSPGEVARLAQCAADAAGTRLAEAREAALWLERAEPADAGLVMLPKDALEIGSPLLPMRALLAAIGGAQHLPNEASTLELIARLRAGKSAALSHTLVRRRRDGLLLSRERRRGQVDDTRRTGAVAPWAEFLPGFDIPLRNAVARLLGVAPVPESPSR
jgi:tRNA(Ile)-lysidine synthase